jgi:hypothetical protein
MQGFMLNFSSDTMATIGDHAVKENKCFMMNLSAPYLSSLFKVCTTIDNANRADDYRLE